MCYGIITPALYIWHLYNHSLLAPRRVHTLHSSINLSLPAPFPPSVAKYCLQHTVLWRDCFNHKKVHLHLLEIYKLYTVPVLVQCIYCTARPNKL